MIQNSKSSKSRVFISGASGLVGSNCQSYFRQMGVDVVGTFFSYQTPSTVFFDTLNENNVNNFDVNTYCPTHIVHCGALTNVDYCENNVEESYIKTVESTSNLLKIANQHQAMFIYISTDYVYDGEAGPYSEDINYNPINVYGKHKLKAEDTVRESANKHLILRITNVYGDEMRNKNFVCRLIQWSLNNEKKELLLPYDQFATPINAFDIARILYLCIKNNVTGVFNFGGNDYYNRYQLAKKVTEYFPSGTITIKGVSSDTLSQNAKRPLRGGLLSNKILSVFPEFTFTNIDSYLHKKENGI